MEDTKMDIKMGINEFLSEEYKEEMLRDKGKTSKKIIPEATSFCIGPDCFVQPYNVAKDPDEIKIVKERIKEYTNIINP